MSLRRFLHSYCVCVIAIIGEGQFRPRPRPTATAATTGKTSCIRAKNFSNRHFSLVNIDQASVCCTSVRVWFSYLYTCFVCIFNVTVLRTSMHSSCLTIRFTFKSNSLKRAVAEVPRILLKTCFVHTLIH